jgi:hypothetical protein
MQWIQEKEENEARIFTVDRTKKRMQEGRMEARVHIVPNESLEGR